MTKLTEFFNTPMGSSAARAVTKVFAGAAVVAAMSSALPAPSANAMPISAAVRSTPHKVPNINYQDVMAFDTKLQPLKKQKQAYEEMIVAYGDLLEGLRAVTFDSSEASPREQVEIYGAVITGWIEQARADIRESKIEEAQANVVDASASVKMKHGSDPELFEKLYRQTVERNKELRESIERMTASLEVIVVYGEAEVDEVAEAFKSYRDFEAELVDLKVAEPSDDPSEELVSTPKP